MVNLHESGRPGHGVAAVHAVDVEEMMACVGGDAEIFREIVDVFLQDLPSATARVREAAAARNASELSQAAHALKGAVSVFGPSAALGTVRQLEIAGCEAQLADTAALSARLDHELDELTAALRHVVEMCTR